MTENILPYYPKKLAMQAVYAYMLGVMVVSLWFRSYLMAWYGWITGLVFVWGFFNYANKFTRHYVTHCTPKVFEKSIFKKAFIIRLLYVIVSYVFYNVMVGEPFEFGMGDAWIYHVSAEGVSRGMMNGNFHLKALVDSVYGTEVAWSDSGYIIYLSFVYLLTGHPILGMSVLPARILKCVISAYMCVLMYRLAKRHFGEETARITAVLCMLFPYFVQYCGLHLKETEMTFLSVLFVERFDHLLHSNKFTWGSTTLAILAGLSLFTFRTVLGAVAFLALFMALVLASSRMVKWGKRILIGALAIVLIWLGVGQRFMGEMMDTWESRGTNQQTSMDHRAETNKFAKYASATVFAPMMFTIPFPTTVSFEDQENAVMMNGANFVKNILSGLVILGLIILLINGTWRQHVFPAAFMLGYLLVIAMSAFAHSGRFHLPAMPFEMMFAAYGLTQLSQPLFRKIFNGWNIVMAVALVAWNWFKLRGRGM